MKIWQLDPAQLTPYYNISLCDALSEAGCSVRYIASPFIYDKLSFSTRFDVDYHYFKGLNHRLLTSYPKLRRVLRAISYPLNHWTLLHEIKRTPPDILHIQWSRIPRIDYWFIDRVKKLSVPIVHTVHEVIPPFAPEQISSLGKVYQHVDALILHTEANLKDFLSQYPHINAQTTHIIPLINAPYSALPMNANRELARQLLNLPNNHFVFLFFGTIRQYKGLDTLLEAFKKVSEIEPTIHLLIAGNANSTSDQKVLDRAQVSPNIHITSGYIPYGDMWKYYLAADVVVLPYKSITQSAALMTAMEFGRAVIVTRVGGLPETVEGNGWIIPPADVAALTNIMIEATQSQEQIANMEKQSAQLVMKKYSPAAIAQQTLAVYKQLL